MTLWRMFLLKVLLAVCLLYPVASKAQPIDQPPVAGCVGADLDTTMQMAEDSRHLCTLSFDFHNISAHPCVLGYNIGLELRREESGEEPYNIPAIHPAGGPFMLGADKTAHISLTWRNTESEGPECYAATNLLAHMSSGDPDGIHPADVQDGAQYILAFSAPYAGIKICSSPTSSPYLPGPSGGAPNSDSGLALRLTKSAWTYYDDHTIWLHIDATDPGKDLPFKGETDKQLYPCPGLKMLQRIRYPNGVVDYREVGDRFKCEVHDKFWGARTLAIDYVLDKSTWNVDQDTLTMPGDRTVSISYASNDHGGWKTMAESNSVALHSGNAENIPPLWGPQSEGFAVSLKLDSDTFKKGEPIKLHMACARLTAGWQITSKDRYEWLCNPEIKLNYSDGTPVKLAEYPPVQIEGRENTCSVMSGKGAPEHQIDIKKDEINFDEIVMDDSSCINNPLNNENNNGYFDRRPGTYTISAIWHARSENPDVKVNVRSVPVTFTITE